MTTPVQPFPNITLAMTTQRGAQPGGFITQPWLNLLRSLWSRTGAAQGGNSVPTGAIFDFAGPQKNIPEGWMFLAPGTGNTALCVDFPQLFAALETTWGGDGVVTFGLPPGDVFFQGGAPGGTGGAASVTLSVDNLPAHNHPVVDPGHVHPSVVVASTNTAGATAGAVTAGNTGSAVTGVTIGDTGSDTPFSILPPYARVIKMIKL